MYPIFSDFSTRRLVGTGSLLLSLVAAPLHADSASAAESSKAKTEPAFDLTPLVVTSAEVASPLEAVLDPKVAAQPLPAQDGADVLKGVPGFSVIRKGGTDGDPVLRGMAGSRLGILLDGQVVLGGCGSRMDPPTAYVFPGAYDRVRILKGPQTVRYGPGSSAGIVIFESDPPDFSENSTQLEGNLTVGSWGRLDLAGIAAAGTDQSFGQVRATRTESDDYEDGDGQKVHSHHLRWSTHADLGWTPDADTLLQLTAIRSDGEAAYADRMMDGVRFARETLSLKFERRNLNERIRLLEAEIGYNYVDHVMDNYSLRPFAGSMMMPNPSVSNPDRRTVVARGLAELEFNDQLALTLGLDHQFNRHAVRNSMNQPMMPYEDQQRMRDADFSQVGAFGEVTFEFDEHQRITAGLRLDHWQATDYRPRVSISMMNTMVNPTAGAERDADLLSGFTRYERDLDEGHTSIFAGIGHTARFLDYWELIRNESTDSVSAFGLDPERTTQLDLGLTRELGPVDLTTSVFYSEIRDFALVQNNFAKAGGMMGMRQAVVTRSIDATTFGGEIALGWKITENWVADASFAYTRGENETDDRPLAQIPPFESRFSLRYVERVWSAGLLLRAVAEQDRVALGQGNIVGQDIGPADGFAILSLNGSWQVTDFARLSAGVDNLFDETYAEHLSRAGAPVAGYSQTTRVNEPGRTLWARLDVQF
jgi:iron complex outermembrane receptor protein